MHPFDPDVNFACSGIIAQGCPPAVGAGLAAKKRSTDSVTVAYLGEGAVDQGGFLESLNLTAVHDLPVVFGVEDNDWAISVPQERVTDAAFASERADGFDMEGTHVDRDDAVDIEDGLVAPVVADVGARNLDGVTPIINPPEVAILGVNRVRERARPDGDGVAFRETLPLDLSFDHRVVDGADAARYLGTLTERIEDAEAYV
jgi:hypothetical protein